MAQRGMLFLESARGDPYFCSHFRAVAQFKPISRFLTDMQHASRSPMSSPSLLSVLGNHEISSISHVTMSPSRQNNLVSMFSSMPSSKSSYSLISAFCTEDNIPHCISYINQVWTVFWVYPLKYLLYFLSVIASLIDFFFFFYSLIYARNQLFVIFAQHNCDLCLRRLHRSSLRWAFPHVSRPTCQEEVIWTQWQLWMPCTSCSRFTGGTWIP